ncbi:hypothetical protein [Loigolactobacillus zhaoyuanensis]|uniref:hypothetical protein n=1 Tax=Loigolactobacillus zhaoyuanensis TaxID=2486017 RepID=UPI0013DDD007|nr:hypothetical protein [Loigolactobacillus zhaoyuanensis]
MAEKVPKMAGADAKSGRKSAKNGRCRCQKWQKKCHFWHYLVSVNIVEKTAIP